MICNVEKQKKKASERVLLVVKLNWWIAGSAVDVVDCLKYVSIVTESTRLRVTK